MDCVSELHFHSFAEADHEERW